MDWDEMEGMEGMEHSRLFGVSPYGDGTGIQVPSLGTTETYAPKKYLL